MTISDYDDITPEKFKEYSEKFKKYLSKYRQDVVDLLQLHHEMNTSEKSWEKSAAKQTFDKHLSIILHFAEVIYGVVKTYERDPTSFLILKQENIEEAVRIHNEAIPMLARIGVVITFTPPKFE